MSTTVFDVIDWLANKAFDYEDGDTPPTPALAGLQVIQGEPGESAEREHIGVGTAAAGDQSWALLGGMHREEQYLVEMFISTRVPGATRDEARDRMAELFGSVEDVLRANPRLGVSGDQYVLGEIATPSFEPFVDEEGFSARCRFAIRVTARI